MTAVLLQRGLFVVLFLFQGRTLNPTHKELLIPTSFRHARFRV